jgi:hypothetical protein
LPGGDLVADVSGDPVVVGDVRRGSLPQSGGANMPSILGVCYWLGQ